MALTFLLRQTSRSLPAVVRQTCSILRPSPSRASGLLPLGRRLLATQQHSPDYYALLGINRTSDIKTIKLAYYRLAKKYHPDNNRGNEAKYMFQLIAEAYDVLSDPSKRDEYDEYGEVRTTFGGTAQSDAPQRPPDHMTYDPEELFEKIFGEADIGRTPGGGFTMPAGEDYAPNAQGIAPSSEYVVNLSFEEAARGACLEIEIRIRYICPKCRGTRSEMGYTGKTCPYCEGTGTETEKIGHVLTRKACSYCDGTREFIKFKCEECAGIGQTILTAPYKLTVPPGSYHGQVLKVPIGDFLLQYTIDHHQHIFVYLMVEDSEYFRRDGHDIHTDADVTIAQAFLGGTVTVRGLHKAELPVPLSAGRASHKVLLVHNEGICHGAGPTAERGDHYVHVGIRVPPLSALSLRQARLLRRFSALLAAAADDDGAHGLVDGAKETDDAHKYRVNVVEADRVTRPFNKSKDMAKESVRTKEKEKSYLEKLREKIIFHQDIDRPAAAPEARRTQ